MMDEEQITAIRERLERIKSAGAPVTASGFYREDVSWLLAALAEARRERDDFQRKYHEAMDILSAWGNIDHAAAVAQLLEARRALKWIRNRANDASPFGPMHILTEITQRADAALAAEPDGTR